MGLEMRALRAALRLTQDEGRTFAENTRAAYASAGATQAAYTEQSKALRVQWALMRSSIEAVATSIGQMFLPVLKEVTGAIGRIASSIRAWIKAHPEIKAAMETLGEAVGGIMGRIEARVEAGLTWLTDNWESVWDTAADRMTKAANWIVTQVGRIVGVIKQLAASRGEIWTWARQVMDAVIAVAQTIAETVMKQIEALYKSVKGIAPWAAGALMALEGAKVGAIGGPWGALAGGVVAGGAGFFGTRAAFGKGEEAFENARMVWLGVYDKAWQRFEQQRAQYIQGEGFFGALREAANEMGVIYSKAFQDWASSYFTQTGGLGGDALGMRQLAAPQFLGLDERGMEIWSSAVYAFGDVAETLEEAAQYLKANGQELNDAAGALESSAQDLSNAADALRPGGAADYTAQQQVDWGVAMAQVAEAEGRIGDALWYMAHAAGYQEEIVAAAAATHEAEGTVEAAQAWADEAVKFRRMIEEGGRLGQQYYGEGMGAKGYPAFADPSAGRPRTADTGWGGVQVTIAPQVNVDTVNSAEDFANLGYQIFYDIWESELGDTMMYNNWTGG
jgi:hypothetical protein